MSSPNGFSGTEIAIVGLAGKFPGAQDVRTYWEKVRDGVELIARFDKEELKAEGLRPELVDDPNFVPANGILEGIDLFDAKFFGFSPRDAAVMDPQHRLFLECAWQALEHAGYDPEQYPGNIGVFGGSGMNLYILYNLMSNPSLVESLGFFHIRHNGNDKDFLTTRVSYEFNLKGPSVNVQTACSTSLVAVHMACQSLLNGESDMALAGGVTLDVQQQKGYLYQPGEVLSPDGHCRAWDEQSAGTVFGSGLGIVVLKRLDDALAAGDHVHAVILGSAINNDGSLKVGYMAPSVDGQAAAVAEALALSGVPAESISYIETHGTGTPVGDPIELTALKQVFGAQTKKPAFCAIGSVKSNIGHLDTAAGVAGLIKTVEALKHREIPPSLHFNRPNPKLGIEGSPFFVNDRLRPWDTNGFPRRAGVSSLGVGGTNAHVIVQEAPAVEAPAPSRDRQLLVLSAKSAKALENAARNLAEHLREHPDLNLADVAYTLKVGRRAFEHRRVLVASSAEQAAELLEAGDPKGAQSFAKPWDKASAVFLFAGGGAQYAAMGRGLYETEPVYKAAVDECLKLLRLYENIDLRPYLFPEADRVEEASKALERPSLSLPALLTTQYALAKLWMSWGVEPAAMVGHSHGEYPAALLAGVMSLKDALSLVALRGRLFETLEQGGMLSVPLPAEEVEPLLGEELSIAAVNTPSLCVASGPVAALDALQKKLVAMDAEGKRVKINVAAHSKMVEPILEEFRAFVTRIKLSAPERPFVSNVTGTWITPEQATDPEYWVRHIRQTVRFSDGIQAVLAEPSRVIVEIGHRALAALTAVHPARQKEQMVLTSLRHPQEEVHDQAFILNTLGQLWNAGYPVDWATFYGDEQRRRVPLPTYPFERQRYWVEPGKQLQGGDGAVVTIEGEAPPEPKRALKKQAKLDDWFFKPVWQKAAAPAAPAQPAGSWLVFAAGIDSLDLALVERLRKDGQTVKTVTIGAAYAQEGPDAFKVNPSDAAHFDSLVRALVTGGGMPARVVHFWSALTPESAQGRDVEGALDRSFYSLFHFAQALGKEDVSQDIQLDVVSTGMQKVLDGEAVSNPEAALALGPVKVVPHEFPNVRCRSIDLDGQDLASRNGAHPLAKLVAELGAEPQDEVIAFRRGERYVQRYERSRIAEPNEVARLRERGVYLLTGGLGGISLTLARYLAETAKARLVLVGRSALPAREAWDALLASPETPASVRTRIREVRALEALGAEVMVATADVADRAQMQALIADVKARFGAVNGVIHAAGVLDDGLILSRTAEAAHAVLAPKVAGALVLEEALAGTELDFFVLFSSSSAAIGAAGQVDYTAANAFLNAFAEYKRAKDGTPAVALGWGMWREVGMAAAAAGQGSGAGEPDAKSAAAIQHAYFRRLLAPSSEEQALIVDLKATDFWFLDEHRLASGESILPGTMYLEMARAAYAQATGEAAATIRNVYFLAPLEVGAEGKEVRVKLTRREGGYGFAVLSRSGPEWTEHAGGQLAAGETGARAHDLEAARARTAQREVSYTGESQPVQPALRFGPRWKNMRQVRYGAGEVLATLELEPGFAADLAGFPLHPALLDIATSAALPLVEGFDAARDFFVPLSYRELRFLKPLTPKVLSHLRYRADKAKSHEVAVFDVTIMDEAGNVLVEIDQYIMRRVADAALMTASGNAAAHKAPVNEALAARLATAIKPSEGVEAFRRVLAAEGLSQVVVSSVDLNALIEEARAAREPVVAVQTDASAYVPPRDEVEEALVELWQSMLGVNPVGIRDDFFALGGHSLIAVRLFARIQKKFGVDLSLATLFQAPTIEDCAAIIREELGMAFTPKAAEAAVPAEAAAPAASGDGATVVPSVPPAPSVPARAWSPLVPIQKNGAKPPFFCVHGAGGNVLNFRDLSVHLGPDQPFYGLQARGVDGKSRPHERIEDMASEYVAAVRTVQPEGPYILGGYSGGGVIAYEMAQQLQAAGEEVSMVVFLDTYYPRLPKVETTKLQKVMHHVRGFATKGTGHLEEIRKFKAQHAAFLDRKSRLQQMLAEGRQLPYDLREIVMTEGFHAAADRYEAAPYAGRVVLLTAEEKPAGLRHVPLHLGWAPLVKGGLEIYPLPGDHDNLVLDPHVLPLVEVLRLELDKAQRAAAMTA